MAKKQHFGKKSIPQKVILAILAEGHNSTADWTRELFKPQKCGKFYTYDLKILVSFKFELFVNVILRVGLDFFGLNHRALGLKTNGQFFVSILLKMWRKSAFLESLIGLLAFVVSKLWPKNHKLFDWWLFKPRGVNYIIFAPKKRVLKWGFSPSVFFKETNIFILWLGSRDQWMRPRNP